jgi:hypothetical protein
MNKKMILFGAAALVGCFVLASFDKKTLAQQNEEIATAVTAKLDALRAEKEAACTETVTAEANTRYQAFLAEEAAKPVPAVAGGKKPVKKGSTAGPKVDPLPQTTAPAKVDPKKDKMDGGTNTQEKVNKMEGQPANTDKKKSKMNGGQ